MAEKRLHIISFDVPYPADYGGVIDVFYKLKALHAHGVRITLHCFHYGRQDSDVLGQYCDQVYYYPRNMNKSYLLNPLPFITVTRHHDALLRHLKQDEAPILFEGKHTCYYLDHPELEDRKRYVRTHNVEAHYYAGLAQLERNPLKSWYLRSESRKLKRFQSQLAHADHLFSISQKDVEYFSEINPRTSLIPPFHSNEDFVFTHEKEAYCLYHGNLAVQENEQAALFLIDDVFKESSHRLIIFGNGASSMLRNAIRKTNGVELQEGGQSELERLVQKAQINVLPTFQATGMKLKLLYSLYNGGHVLVNPPMVAGTGAERAVYIARDADGFRALLDELMGIEFSHVDQANRKAMLQPLFSNEQHAQAMIRIIWPEN